MALQRRSRFGFPQGPPQDSTHTTRSIPLTGMAPNLPWPGRDPGSALSLVNLYPTDGALKPRSRLSSLNTIKVPGDEVHGLHELPQADLGAPFLWYSCNTVHGILTSNGSVSRASFISSFGLGAGSLVASTAWQYALAYSDTSDRNILIAAPITSYDTLFSLYQNDSDVPFYSYLTSAPETRSVGAFDNYVVAFNTREGGLALPTRVRWCVRGNPSNWTSEGAGFEDLLQMRGSGSAVKGGRDGRLYLFGDKEIWYGVGATYPAQFQFFPLDTTIGCPYPMTIRETDRGYLYLGSDLHVRLLPYGGGTPEPVVPSLRPLLGQVRHSTLPSRSWAVYDPVTRIYQLHFQRNSSIAPAVYQVFAINVDTAEWSVLEYPTGTSSPRCGYVTTQWNTRYTDTEGVFFGTSTGTIYSTHSLLATDSGSTVTAMLRPAIIAPDLAGNWKQLTDVNVDFRATSKGTLNINLSTDGGNNYSSAGVVSMNSAPVSGRSNLNVYAGGAFPAIELTSTSTGYELHRLDVSMTIGGRR